MFVNRLFIIVIIVLRKNKTMTQLKGVKALFVYQKAYKLAMDIFVASKRFPKEEIYSLTSQIRKSSRSVCANLAEGYSKRNYPKHFLSKLAISDGELYETLTWLDFAKDCEYMNSTDHQKFHDRYEEVGKMLGNMISAPEKFASRKKTSLPKN